MLHETKFNFIHYPVVGSTNRQAQECILVGTAQHGDVIYTDWQSEGRGQTGNTWESEANTNLLCSLILKPHHIAPAQQFILTQVVSLGILSGLKLLGLNSVIHVKWPNDIYIENEKVGGILFQNSIVGNVLEYSVVGIGINVNQRVFSDKLPNPTSVCKQVGYELDLDVFRVQIFQAIGQYYSLTYSKHGLRKLEEDYLLNLYWINQWRIYQASTGCFEGRIQGVDEYGRLLVEQRNGISLYFQLKEIVFVK